MRFKRVHDLSLLWDVSICQLDGFLDDPAGIVVQTHE